MTSATIDCVDIHLGFRSPRGLVPVLDGISVGVLAGELHCVIGPSGCGKSTLLNLIAGLLRPSSGVIRLDGSALGRGLTRGAAYMTQKDTLLPWFSARRNVQIPLEATGRTNGARATASTLLVGMGLAGFEEHLPHELSGGMRQRVLLARMLAQEPRLLLMDEPFASLDYQTKMLIHERFLEIWAVNKPTVVFVTHDLQEAITLADRITILSRPPSRVKAQYQVAIARPRRMDLLIQTSEYQQLYQDIWRSLRDEIVVDDARSTSLTLRTSIQ